VKIHIIIGYSAYSVAWGVLSYIYDFLEEGGIRIEEL
jgi:hypothetical protein